MSVPGHDELFAALVRLRELAPDAMRRDRASWDVVERWLRANEPRRQHADDAHQETLIAIARHVSTLEAEHPGAAVRWVRTIQSRKYIDLLRTEKRSPSRLGLAFASSEEAPSPVDLLERDDAREVDPEALEKLIETVESAIAEHVERTYTHAADRQLRRLQARAILHRALGQDLDGVRAALALGDDVGGDRIYKWIERGRPVLLAVLETAREGVSDESQAVFDALRDLVAARRADAGRPRPDRTTKGKQR